MRNNRKVSSAWRYICTAHAVRCLADRSWKFFIPLYLSRMCLSSSLRPTAAISIAQSLAVATLSTTVANRYRRHHNLTEAFVWATLLENLAVALGGICICYFITDDSLGANRCHEPFKSNYFILALLCGAVDAVFSSLLSMVISKEWVAVLCRDKHHVGEKKHRLARANATLSQIDLGVAALSPLIVSFGIRHGGGYETMLVAMVSQHVLGASIIVYSVRRALHLCPQLTASHKKQDDSSSMHHNEDGEAKVNLDQNQGQEMLGMASIRSQLPVNTQLTVTAYVLLYFTILSPGSVLNAWMNSVKHVDISEDTIAYFGSASQMCGALATIVSPLLIRCCSSLHFSGAIAQWFQTICVLCGVVCFYRLSWIENNYSGNMDVENSSLLLWGFLFCIGISRLGLWTFDLVERQIVQESVPRVQQTLFFNAERGATQLVSLGMMYLCFLFPDSVDFLVNLSMIGVCSSSVLLLLQFSTRLPSSRAAGKQCVE